MTTLTIFDLIGKVIPQISQVLKTIMLIVY
jgi:hypothetical protein